MTAGTILGGLGLSMAAHATFLGFRVVHRCFEADKITLFIARLGMALTALFQGFVVT